MFTLRVEQNYTHHCQSSSGQSMNSFRCILLWLILISIQIGINCIYSIDDDTELDIMYRRLR